MIINHFKIAFRNFVRHKSFSVINISGLALGLAVFMLIMLWVQNELSYDSFNEDKERIAAVMINKKFDNGEIQTFPAVSALIAETMQKDLPEVQYATTTSWGDVRQFTYKNKHFTESGLYVSPEFLKVFSFPLIKGNINSVLKQPNTILITEQLSKKYFGEEDPIGKTITIEQSTDYKVEGVLKDMPVNATLTFDFLMPVNDYIKFSMNRKPDWGDNNIRAYVKLKSGVDRAAFEKRFTDFLSNYTDKQPKTTTFLWYLQDWYLRYDYKDGKYAGGGRITYVRLFIAIAVFILLLACINFMNLSTARATHRAKEVGVRKVVGAGKYSLLKQFMTESFLLSFISGVIAIVLVFLVLPYFNTLLRKHIELDFTISQNIILFLSIIFITGLLAGSYPAFVLSSYKPVSVLKNAAASSSGSAAWIRKGLVVTQFTVSVLLIIGTLIISQQINYIEQKDLGYKKDHLVWFPNNVASDKNEAFKSELKKVPGVISSSEASMTFTMSNNRGSEVSWPDKKQDVFFNFIAGGNDIIQTMDIEMKAGRAFQVNNSADTSAVILNEEAVKRMNLTNPVGQILDMNYGKATVVGVAKDFHYESLHNPIGPVIIMCRPNWTWLMYVRTDGKEIQTTLKGIEAQYKSFAPGFVFDYNFQDKEFERLYSSESQIGVLINWFAFFAILISCLGLLGLTAYTVERKTKEIGIRKILGASVVGIVLLVFRQFMWLILLAVLIALAPAWYFMQGWLQQYAYKISLSWHVFVIAGALAIVIALITISFQSVKAALMNPVKSLRTE